MKKICILDPIECPVCHKIQRNIVDHIRSLHSKETKKAASLVWRRNRPIINPGYINDSVLRELASIELNHNISKMPSSKILSYANRGYEWAWNEVKRRYGHWVKAQAIKVAGLFKRPFGQDGAEQVDDIEQDLWVYILKGIRCWKKTKVKSTMSANTYIYRIIKTATPKIVSMYNRQKPDNQLLESDFIDHEKDNFIDGSFEYDIMQLHSTSNERNMDEKLDIEYDVQRYIKESKLFPKDTTS